MHEKSDDVKQTGGILEYLSKVSVLDTQIRDEKMYFTNMSSFSLLPFKYSQKHRKMQKARPTFSSTGTTWYRFITGLDIKCTSVRTVIDHLSLTFVRV